MTLTVPFLHDFILRQRYAVVSSNGPHGTPQSALVGIAASESLEIYFDTVDTTRKIKNIRSDSRVSLVIGWQNEQTLQYEGVADEPEGAALADLKAAYFRTRRSRASIVERHNLLPRASDLAAVLKLCRTAADRGNAFSGALTYSFAEIFGN